MYVLQCRISEEALSFQERRKIAAKVDGTFNVQNSTHFVLNRHCICIIKKTSIVCICIERAKKILTSLWTDLLEFERDHFDEHLQYSENAMVQVKTNDR